MNMFMDERIYIGSTITIKCNAGDRIKIANSTKTILDDVATQDNPQYDSTEWESGYYSAVLYKIDGTMDIQNTDVIDPFTQQDQLNELRVQLADVQAVLHHIVTGTASTHTINNKTIEYLALPDLLQLESSLIQKINTLKRAKRNGKYFAGSIKILTR